MKKIKSVDFKLINFIIGIVAVLMIFMPVLIFRDSETSYTGLEIAFGKEFVNLGGLGSGQIAFNPLVLLAFLLPLAGAIIPLFYSKGFMLSVVLYAIAAVLIFMIPQFTVVTVTILGNTNEIDVEWTYGIGLIIAAVLSILGLSLSTLEVYKRR